jgi:molybdopterin synthase sulfur carrier subunit
MRVTVRYFASLRDAAGIDAESVETGGELGALYEQLRTRHAIAMDAQRLRVAVNGAFVAWTSTLRDGDEVVFIPPVSGG